MSDVLAAKGVVSVGDNSTPSEEMGFAPRALLLWWSCQPRDGVSGGNRGGIGFAVPGSRGAATAWASEDRAPRVSSASWAEETPIVGLADSTSTPALRAEVEFAERGFALRVLEAAAVWCVHYLALGGDVKASIGWLSAPDTPAAQRLDVGLRPDLVLFASAGVGGHASLTRGISIALGASTGPAAQVSAAFASRDGAKPGSVGGAQRSDAAIVAVRDGVELDALARVREFDQDGITLQWTRSPSTPRQVLCLALAGVCCAVGSGSSPKAPRRRRTRVVGVDPRGLICFSWGLESSAAASSIGRLSLGGATSSTDSGVTSWDDCNQPASITSTHVQSSTDHVLLVVDTQTGGLHAAASLASFDSGALTFDWSRSDGFRRQFLYALVGARRRSRLWTTVAWLRSHLPH